MGLNIKKATRELIWSKVALMSPSGGGKTYSALRLATGMLEELKKKGLEQNGKILMVNTEQKRGYYYANEFVYDIADVDSPHNPEKYVEIIREAVEANYPILILDSSSHEWEGKGGCLDLQQQAGGTYQAWGKVTPRHNKFIEAIADSPIHLIATMRGKDQYEIEKGGDNSKLNVKKLGVGAKQREGFEYEFTVTFNIDQKSNLASSQKDNTHIFEREGDVILTEAHGKQLIDWANSGEGYTPPVRNGKTEKELNDELLKLCTDLGGSKNEELLTLLKKYEPNRGNPVEIKEDKLKMELLTVLQNMKTATQNTKKEGK